jgi:threonine 3-dehydrogenase
MPEKMKAVVKTKREPGAELVEIPIPPVGPNEVLVKVKATSICGTDVHIYEWDPWSQGRIKNIPQTMGHEFAGEIMELGSNVTRLKKGDIISAETHIPCFNCDTCFERQFHVCQNLKIFGVDCNGCFSEYMVAPEVVCWKNDPSVPPEHLCVQEPLGNAAYTVLTAPVAGETMMIIGDGPTALFAAGVAKVAGAVFIMQVCRHPYRMEIARKMGADVTVNEKEEDLDAVVQKHIGKGGFDIVLEMAGSEAAIDQMAKYIRKGGRISAFGVAKDKVLFDYNNAAVFKGSTIYGINGRLMFDTWKQVRNMLKYKKLDVAPVVTHKLHLVDYEEGFSLMMTRPKVCGKVVLFPHGM